MEFPITNLLSPSESTQWLLDYFHPQGLMCPNCGDPVTNAYVFRTTKKSQLTVYRCRECNTAYNLYTNTLFQQRHFTPAQVVLFLRGVLKGEASMTLAAELKVSVQTILDLRRDVQDSARCLQPNTPLSDEQTETDEMFQNAGGKKVRNTLILWIRRVVVRTNSAGVGPMPMIAHRLLGRLGARVVKCACAWWRTQPAQRWKRTCINSLTPTPWCTATNRTVTITFFAPMRRWRMAFTNMRVMMTGTEFGRCTATPPKGCGPMRAIFCVRSKASTRNTWRAMSRFVNFDVI